MRMLVHGENRHPMRRIIGQSVLTIHGAYEVGKWSSTWNHQ
jgi:hypothetical protein